eukprot:scaffold18240_cov52-Phaeocystis_antarctica.AAC.1
MEVGPQNATVHGAGGALADTVVDQERVQVVTMQAPQAGCVQSWHATALETRLVSSRNTAITVGGAVQVHHYGGHRGRRHPSHLGPRHHPRGHRALAARCRRGRALTRHTHRAPHCPHLRCAPTAPRHGAQTRVTPRRDTQAQMNVAAFNDPSANAPVPTQPQPQPQPTSSVWVTARRSTRSSSRRSASTGGSSTSASPCARSCWLTTRMTRCVPGLATWLAPPPMLTPTRGVRFCAGGVVPQVPRPHHGQRGSTVFLRVTRRVFLHIFVSDCGTGSLLISIDDTFAPFSS